MYTFETRVRYSDVGPDGLMDNVSVLNAFQDCSSLQSEDLGIGNEYLKQHDIFWLVVYWNLHIYRYPALGERIIAGTSPYRLRGFMGSRNFMLETQEGERIAEADSVWPLINRTTQKPVRIHPVMLEKYELYERFPMEETQRKIKVPAPLLQAARADAGEETEGIVRHEPVLVDTYRLDTNGHMNNAQYLRIAEAVCPAVRQARRLRIEYRKQAYEGDMILPLVYEDRLVALCDREGDPYAVVSAEPQT